VKVGIFLVCLVPLGYIAWKFFNNKLGANPIRELEIQTGLWTLRFLAITLSVTPARRLFGTLAGTYTAVSAFTDYPLSVKRAIPFKAHGATELAIAAVLPFLPWALGFADHRAARNVCFGLTALTVVVAALTDWDGNE